MKLRLISESYDDLPDEDGFGDICVGCNTELDDLTVWIQCDECNASLCEKCGTKAAYDNYGIVDPDGLNWSFEFSTETGSFYDGELIGAHCSQHSKRAP